MDGRFVRGSFFIEIEGDLKFIMKALFSSLSIDGSEKNFSLYDSGGMLATRIKLAIVGYSKLVLIMTLFLITPFF